MKDYSQSGEQEAILNGVRLSDGNPGRLLDIGAYHPTVFSNSRALIEHNWEAVMIEASPGPMRALIAEYGSNEKITLIQAAAAINPGLVEMHISDDAVSTSDAASYETWKTAGGFVGKILVPAITLADIFNRFGGFDFINIDVEGTSADVLLEILRMGVFPRCICCEVDPGRLNEMMTKASAAHYAAKVIGANVVLWQ